MRGRWKSLRRFLWDKYFPLFLLSLSFHSEITIMSVVSWSEDSVSMNWLKFQGAWPITCQQISPVQDAVGGKVWNIAETGASNKTLGLVRLGLKHSWNGSEEKVGHISKSDKACLHPVSGAHHLEMPQYPTALPVCCFAAWFLTVLCLE